MDDEDKDCTANEGQELAFGAHDEAPPALTALEETHAACALEVRRIGQTLKTARRTNDILLAEATQNKQLIAQLQEQRIALWATILLLYGTYLCFHVLV